MSDLSAPGVVAIALAGLWVLVALAVSLIAARRLSRAEAVLSGASRLQGLLQLSPARPVVVRSDGSIEADPRLLRGPQPEGQVERPLQDATVAHRHDRLVAVLRRVDVVDALKARSEEGEAAEEDCLVVVEMIAKPQAAEEIERG